IVELIHYLRHHERPEVISLSNALLAGMARMLKRELNVPIVCTLQGEDSFLDALPLSHRQLAWNTLADRCRDIDLFVAPSRYFGELMQRRLQLPPEKVRVVYNGIHLDGWQVADSPPDPPVLGFFARMCKEKGLHTLVDAFIALKKRGRIQNLKLHVGGAMGPADEPFVTELKLRLQGNAVLGDVTFFSNISRAQKQQFFRRISALCVPAEFGEAFGLYLLEAWAAAVPVVQPPLAAFPELIQETGGGVVAKSTSPEALGDAIESLLLDENGRKQLGLRGRRAVEERFSSGGMASQMVEAFASVLPKKTAIQLS
ncbi:MAG TPA: glycosyltransferase family 4 protein, partial [Verrucomicrobiae bacterium]|nr:glycosyltransferase family 4 protein [Verrucomicrobiae bacterium]